MNDSELYGKVAPEKLFFIIAIPGAISMVACAVISITESLLMILSPKPLVSLFIREGEAALIAMAAYAIRIYWLDVPDAMVWIHRAVFHGRGGVSTPRNDPVGLQCAPITLLPVL